jgi:hypothetical protein
MNKKILISTMLVAAMFSISTSAIMAYNEPSGWAAPACNNEKPQKAWLYRVKSLGNGKYQLFWDKADRASSWTIGYGTSPGNYIYGLNSFGNDQSRNLTVNTYSNKKFYFAIKANNGCMPGEWSNEWGVGTGTGTVAVAKTTAVKSTSSATTKSVVAPVVTKAPSKQTTPVVTKAPAAQEKAAAPATAKKGGFWEWLKGLFGR